MYNEVNNHNLDFQNVRLNSYSRASDNQCPALILAFPLINSGPTHGPL